MKSHEDELLGRVVSAWEPRLEEMRQAGTDPASHPYTAAAGCVHEQPSTEWAQYCYDKYRPTAQMLDAWEAEIDEIAQANPGDVFDPGGSKALAERMQKLEATIAPSGDEE